MDLIIFSVFDSKAEAFLQPFFSPTRATGMRAFSGAVADPSQMFSRYPADFTLFEIGVFRGESAIIEAHESKISLGTALEHVKQDALEEPHLGIVA